MSEQKIKLIDKDRLIDCITYNANIGGEERLLSKTEVIALIEEQHVWAEKTVRRF